MGIRTAAMLAVAVASTLVGCKDDPAPIQQAIDAAAPDIDAPPGVCGNSQVDFLQPCNDNSQCGSCECHMTIHALLCNKTCTTNAECPSPSRGCDGTYCRD